MKPMQFCNKYLLLSLFFVIFGYSQSNDVTIESLKKQFLLEKNQETQTKIALQIAELNKYTNLDEVTFYANKAYSFAKPNKNYLQQVQAIQFLGNVAIIKGNYNQANSYFKEAKTVYENELPNNYEGILKTIGSLGVIASEQSNYNKALEFYLQGKTIAKNNKLTKLEIILNNNIGVIYKSINRPKDALKILNETQILQEKTKDANRGITLTNIAVIYEQLNQLNQEKKFLDLANYALRNSQDYRAIGELENNMGSYFYKTKNFSEAEKYWNNALTNFAKIDDQFGSFDTHYYLSNLKKTENKTDEALQFALKAKNLAYKINVLEHKTKVEKLLSELYEVKNNINLALLHSKSYQMLKDSLVNQENVQKLTQAEMNFAFEKEKLKQQEALSSANKKQWFWAMGLLISVLLFGLFYVQKKKQQQKQQLELENQLLDYKQKALHLQMNPHFLFNCLAAISSFIMQNEKEEAAKYLAMFSKLMRFTLESSKENWITIDKELASLRQYLSLEQLRLKNVFDFTITKAISVEDDMLVPPMLIQPLVENAIIHGILPKQVKGRIDLNFEVQNNLLYVTITDDGIGIENSKKLKENQVELHKSMALSIIKERLEMLQKNSNKTAKLEYMQTNSGTRVLLIVPIK
jgi:chemotaxis protein histidine kinase CheA